MRVSVSLRYTIGLCVAAARLCALLSAGPTLASPHASSHAPPLTSSHAPPLNSSLAPPLASSLTSQIECEDGFALEYACLNVDLEAFLPLDHFNSVSANDIWGWTDPLTGIEYALLGLREGTAFIDLSNPQEPLYLGHLPSHSRASPWRDIKVYDGYAFIISEALRHGMQIFDLTRLRKLEVELSEDSTTAFPVVENFKVKLKNISTAIEDGIGFATSVEIEIPATTIIALAGSDYEEELEKKPKTLGGKTEASLSVERKKDGSDAGVDISTLRDGFNDHLKEREGTCAITPGP